jgi:hypothetical protein
MICNDLERILSYGIKPLVFATVASIGNTFTDWSRWCRANSIYMYLAASKLLAFFSADYESS